MCSLHQFRVLTSPSLKLLTGQLSRLGGLHQRAQRWQALGALQRRDVPRQPHVAFLCEFFPPGRRLDCHQRLRRRQPPEFLDGQARAQCIGQERVKL